jgi:predicted adenine nucleotide alpha hydrolase (AANH) superfamily ATPase
MVIEMKEDIPYGNYDKVLIHICCAPDITYPFFYLRGRHYAVTGFFFNPNVYPETEYQKRLEEVVDFSETTGMPLIKGDYSTNEWFEYVKGHEKDLEGGERCRICYKYRLEKTAQTAKKMGFDFFTTTLSISPHKNVKWIFEIGEEFEKLYNLSFLRADFKKRNGFKSSLILSKFYGMYRQNYCGCKFSKSVETEDL